MPVSIVLLVAVRYCSIDGGKAYRNIPTNISSYIDGTSSGVIDNYPR